MSGFGGKDIQADTIKQAINAFATFLKDNAANIEKRREASMALDEAERQKAADEAQKKHDEENGGADPDEVEPLPIPVRPVEEKK